MGLDIVPVSGGKDSTVVALRLAELHPEKEFNLWKDHPEIYADAEAQEEKTGHTFRSDQRDTWPADLKSLRLKFESGGIPRGADCQMEMFDDGRKCRVCSL